MVSSNGCYLRHWVASYGSLDLATEWLETTQRVECFATFSIFVELIPLVVISLWTNKHIFESISCINAMICVLSHQCKICPPACIQQLLHDSETGKFSLQAIFLNCLQPEFIKGMLVLCCSYIVCCILCLEIDSGCIKKKKSGLLSVLVRLLRQWKGKWHKKI